MKFDFEGNLKEKVILEEALKHIEMKEVVTQVLYCKTPRKSENKRYILKTQNQICSVEISPDKNDEGQVVDITQWRLKDINRVKRQIVYNNEKQIYYTRTIEIFFDSGEELMIRTNDFVTSKNENFVIEFLNSIELGV